MKKIQYNGLKAAILFFILLPFLTGCKKYEVKSLGPKPVASFTVSPVAGKPNTYLLTSTSTNSFRYDWNKATGSYVQGKQVDTAYFIFSGTYTVKLVVYGQSGIDSTSQVINVAASDPTACLGTQLGFITSCTSKKWKLDPDAGAYKVGPNPNDGSWWQNNLADVAARSCEFNDEYTFSFNANATFAYDNKGDFYADGYLGTNSSGCEPTANYTPIQRPWGSGTFTYSFTPNAGVAGLGQLTVNGLGAHIGLQKVQNGIEATTPQSTAITYDVLARSSVAGYDLLTLGVNMGWGWWTFRLRSF
jgi:hypothetical protein